MRWPSWPYKSVQVGSAIVCERFSRYSSDLDSYSPPAGEDSATRTDRVDWYPSSPLVRVVIEIERVTGKKLTCRFQPPSKIAHHHDREDKSGEE